MSCPHQEGLSLQVQLRTQAKTRKNATKLADGCIAHECGVLKTIERQNPNCNGVVATDYKGSRDVHVPPGGNPHGIDTIHGPKGKNGGAAPRQILGVQVFRQFLLIPDEFVYGTSSIGMAIPLNL
jgi:hypothetical protein